LPAKEQRSWHLAVRNTLRALETGQASAHERDLSIVLDHYAGTLAADIDNGKFA